MTFFWIACAGLTGANSITPSERQLGDVAGVVQVQRGKLDEPYLRHWATELGVAAELEAALSGAIRLKHT